MNKQENINLYAKLLKAACKVFGTDYDACSTKSRKAEHVITRSVIVYYLKQKSLNNSIISGLAKPSIDRTSIYHTFPAFENDMIRNQDILMKYLEFVDIIERDLTVRMPNQYGMVSKKAVSRWARLMQKKVIYTLQKNLGEEITKQIIDKVTFYDLKP